jgi:hypothetical protein
MYFDRGKMGWQGKGVLGPVKIAFQQHQQEDCPIHKSVSLLAPAAGAFLEIGGRTSEVANHAVQAARPLRYRFWHERGDPDSVADTELNAGRPRQNLRDLKSDIDQNRHLTAPDGQG